MGSEIIQQKDNEFCGVSLKIYLVFEYIDTNLENIINQHKIQRTPFTEDELWVILQGSVEVHSGIYHGRHWRSCRVCT